jgi:hypothetical protein
LCWKREQPKEIEMDSRLTELALHLELEVQEVVRRLVKEFNQRNLRYIHFSIEAAGSTHGDVSIKYQVGTHNYSGDCAKGNRIVPVTEEYLRRHEWEEKNDQVLLTFDGSGDLKDTMMDGDPSP